MNFYKEVINEFKNAGIQGKIKPVPDSLRPTCNDFADLEKRISIRVYENAIMIEKSKILADYCMI